MLTLMKFIGVWKVYAITMIYYTIDYTITMSEKLLILEPNAYILSRLLIKIQTLVLIHNIHRINAWNNYNDI